MDWEEILESEGMPSELPLLRCESIERMNEYGKEITRIHHDPVSALFGSLYDPFIEQAMEYLTDREKEIIWMKHVELMTERDIAEKLKISRRTVRKTLNRARGKMKKRLYRLEKILEKSQICRP